MIDVTALKATRDKAILRLDRNEDIQMQAGGLWVVDTRDGKDRYEEAWDWEIGTVLALGHEIEEEGLEVGDRIMVRAISGGVAGADISKEVGERPNSVVVVKKDEIVAKIGD